MGTPHRGTGTITSKKLVYAAITSTSSLRIEDTILKALESGNNIFIDVLNNFILLYNSPDVQMLLCCFFEQRSTAISRIIGNSLFRVFISLILVLVQESSLICHKNSLLIKFPAVLTGTRNTALFLIIFV
jgi:hypothetical protein